MSTLLKLLQLVKSGYRVTFSFNTDTQAYRCIAHRIGREDYDVGEIPRDMVIKAAEAGTPCLDQLVKTQLLDRIL